MTLALIPSHLIQRSVPSAADRYAVNVAISHSTVLIVLFFAPAVFSWLTEMPHACLFRSLLGIPCPGCGVITSLRLLAEGRILQSVSANLLGVVTVAFLLIALVIS